MSEADVQQYHFLTSEPLKALPTVEQMISVSRRQGMLHVSFVPLVYRDGKYQKLVSFMLKIKGHRLSKKVLRAQALQRASATSRYAENSVLRSGNWAKIRVPSTGIYQLTTDLVQKAGFSNLSKVKVYGYGGGLQPERLTGDYLSETDDLKEVPTCTVNGKRLFYAVGPVTWNASYQRVRNPYSDYGYYFLTENDSVPAQEQLGLQQSQ